MSIHEQWEDAITEIEEAERNVDDAEHCQCKCNQHGNPSHKTMTKIGKWVRLDGLLGRIFSIWCPYCSAGGIGGWL